MSKVLRYNSHKWRCLSVPAACADAHRVQLFSPTATSNCHKTMRHSYVFSKILKAAGLDWVKTLLATEDCFPSQCRLLQSLWRQWSHTDLYSWEYFCSVKIFSMMVCPLTNFINSYNYVYSQAWYYSLNVRRNHCYLILQLSKPICSHFLRCEIGFTLLPNQFKQIWKRAELCAVICICWLTLLLLLLNLQIKNRFVSSPHPLL